MKQAILFVFTLLLCSFANAQIVAKVKPMEVNYDNPFYENHFHFTSLINIEHTPLKPKNNLMTCWSFAGNSFIESEMMRMGKHPYDLSEIYVIRNVLLEKAKNYVKMHGAITWNDAGECHDMINLYSQYGAIPDEVYPGNHKITTAKFAQMMDELTGILHEATEKPNDNYPNAWQKPFEKTLNHYLGYVPDKFQYDGHNFTSYGFARRAVGIHPEDYIEFTSFTKEPLYKKIVLKMPDNWNFERVYNIKVEDITNIIDYALTKGFTVLWSADVSEKFFSRETGVAYVPYTPYDDMTEEEKRDMFAGPQPERNITPQLRQSAFDNYQTTDEHGMHIIGLAEDIHHKKYYIVKNTWEVNNGYKGYCYVTKAFVEYKTISILVHKSALTTSMRNKLNLGLTTEY